MNDGPNLDRWFEGNSVAEDSFFVHLQIGVLHVVPESPDFG